MSSSAVQGATELVDLTCERTEGWAAGLVLAGRRSSGPTTPTGSWRRSVATTLLDAVTGSDDGARGLDRLAGVNQLVIRLDTDGEWFRYHHLFRDLLLLEARRSIPDRLPERAPDLGRSGKLYAVEQVIEVHPVSRERWPDLVQLFERPGPRGGTPMPGSCWCMWWRQRTGSACPATLRKR